MTDEQKKALTLWLGECWIENKRPTIEELEKILGGPTQDVSILPNGELKVSPYNRSFTTPQDVFDCKDRLVENGEWGEFVYWAERKWSPEAPMIANFIRWLLNPTRFCELVDRWLKGKEKDNG